MARIPLKDRPARPLGNSARLACGGRPQCPWPSREAIAPIGHHQEICRDDFTAMRQDSWLMACRCREPDGRRLIADCPDLPLPQQRADLNRGLVQRCIRRRLRRQADGLP